LLLRDVAVVADFECVPATFTCFFALAVLVLGLEASPGAPPAFESPEDVCASAARGEMQAHITARAQPALNHVCIVALSFRFGRKGNPQIAERAALRAIPKYGLKKQEAQLKPAL
jgi:hypothetical protein